MENVIDSVIHREIKDDIEVGKIWRQRAHGTK